MVGDGPIRIGEHEWIVIRDNPRVPKAVIRRIDPGGPNEHYRVVSFAIKSEDRSLLGRYRTLEGANDSVLYENPNPKWPPASHDAPQKRGREMLGTTVAS